MILNKSSVERGFAHATLYKTETINLREERGRDMVFGPDPRPRRQRRGAAERPRGAFGQEFPQVGREAFEPPTRGLFASGSPRKSRTASKIVSMTCAPVCTSITCHLDSAHL